MSCKAPLNCICSFSSEDPNHPASNLLKPDTFRKWKCREAGEKEAFVIIQLDKVEKIMSLDIGNEGSAFIEISVSRSGGTNQEFHVIQNQTAFMSVTESKEETNLNRVKMFSSSLVKSVAAEKWDLIKISCIQPFNRRIQYGISFINVIIQADPSSHPNSSTIGKFRVLNTATEDIDSSAVNPDPIRIGSFFAKRMAAADDAKGAKSPPTTSNSRLAASPAAAIRTTSVPPLSKTRGTGHTTSLPPPLQSKEDLTTTCSSKVDNTPTKNGPLLATTKHQFTPLADSGGQSPIWSSNASVTGNKTDAKTKIHSPHASTALAQHSSPKPSTSSLSTSSSHKPTMSSKPSTSTTTASLPNVAAKSKGPVKSKTTSGKPFHKLFEDVVFVLSGFENPFRSTLRRKAVEMGGQCKPDWTPACTHLICAFVNTPKFRQVKGTRHGKIVTKNWIEDSYRLKRRFPWRRYCLDKSDKGRESEDEIPAVEEEEQEESTNSETEEGSDEGYTLAVDILDSQESGIVIDKKNGHRCGRSVRLRDSEEDKEGDEDDILMSDASTSGKRKAGGGTKRRRIARISSSSEDDDSAYDVDTEVDEPGSHTNDFSERTSIESNHRHNKCNDFFNSNLFLLQRPNAESEDQRKEIEQIIQTHKGLVTCSSGSDVNYIVTWETTWIQEFSQLMSQNPNAEIVQARWIETCAQENKLVDKECFIISPE